MNACDERSEALGQDFVDGQKSMQTFLQVSNTSIFCVLLYRMHLFMYYDLDHL